MVLRGVARSDPGRADRGRRASRAREPARGAVRAPRLPRLRDPGPRRRQVPRRRAADPRDASRRDGRRRARARFGLPAEGPVLAVFGALAGARSAERASRSTRSAHDGPGGAARLAASATTSACARGSKRDDYVLVPSTDRLRRRARRGRPRDLARGRHGVGARRGRHAGDPRPVSARDRRSPDAERAVLRARRRRDRRARDASSTASRRSSTSCSTTRRGSTRMSERDARARQPDAADEIAEELIALAGR